MRFHTRQTIRPPTIPGSCSKSTEPPNPRPSFFRLAPVKPPTMASMPAEERIALIKENLAETLDFDIIEKIINDGKDPKVYWGT